MSIECRTHQMTVRLRRLVWVGRYGSTLIEAERGRRGSGVCGEETGKGDGI